MKTNTPVTMIRDSGRAVNLTGRKPVVIARHPNVGVLVERVTDGRLFLVLTPGANREDAQRWLVVLYADEV